MNCRARAPRCSCSVICRWSGSLAGSSHHHGDSSSFFTGWSPVDTAWGFFLFPTFPNAKTATPPVPCRVNRTLREASNLLGSSPSVPHFLRLAALRDPEKRPETPLHNRVVPRAPPHFDGVSSHMRSACIRASARRCSSRPPVSPRVPHGGGDASPPPHFLAIRATPWSTQRTRDAASGRESSSAYIVPRISAQHPLHLGPGSGKRTFRRRAVQRLGDRCEEDSEALRTLDLVKIQRLTPVQNDEVRRLPVSWLSRSKSG
jgi:hypothetical protein